MIGYSVNVLELNVNVDSKADNGVICKAVNKVSKLITELTCSSCYVYGCVSSCIEATVTAVEIKDGLFGYTLGKVAVNLLDNLHRLVVVVLVLLNLVLDLLFGKAVKLLKSFKVLAVKNILEINVVEDLKKIVNGYVLDECICVTGGLGHCREHLLLKLIGNS